MTALLEAMVRSILVVESARVSTDIFRDILMHEGFLVLMARDPDHAVDMLRQIRPDLILTSYPLYTDSGVTLTESVRANELTADVPIVDVAHGGSAEHHRAALASGVSLSLELPVEPRMFLNTVSNFIDDYRRGALRRRLHLEA